MIWSPRARLYMKVRTRLLLRVDALIAEGGADNVRLAERLQRRATRALEHVTALEVPRLRANATQKEGSP